MRKLNGLQYLRALAAFGVAGSHAADRLNRSFVIGESGVDLFFLLSGFLMVTITGRSTMPGAFLADRVRRIVPAYWIATTVMLIGGLAGAFPHIGLNAAHIAASYLFVPWRNPVNERLWPLLVPGWTLNYEMIFYLLFAVLMPIRSQTLQVFALSALFAFLTILGVMFRPHGALLDFYTNAILLEFAAGTWLGIAWKREGAWPRWLGPYTAALALGLLATGALFGFPLTHVIGFGVPALLLLASVLAIERRTPVPPSRVGLLLGDASYSVYLWHGLGISIAASVCARAGMFAPATIAIAVLTGAVGGLVAYALVERPILAFLPKWRATPHPDPART